MFECVCLCVDEIVCDEYKVGLRDNFAVVVHYSSLIGFSMGSVSRGRAQLSKIPSFKPTCRDDESLTL